MCGIIGYRPLGGVDEDVVVAAFTRLLDESRIRGTHAYGIAETNDPTEISCYRTFDWTELPPLFNPAVPTIAHTRYCQSGDWQVMANNQPIVINEQIMEGCALAFNGCIDMGAKSEFEARWDVQCATDNDGEIFMRKCLVGNEKPKDWLRAIRGSFAGVWLVGGELFAARNARRPLWTCRSLGADWYASTADIFRRAGFSGATEVEAV